MVRRGGSRRSGEPSQKDEDRKEGEEATGGEEEDVYEMEDVLEYAQENGEDMFKVKWKGYNLDMATWEPKSNILQPGKMLEDRMKILKQEAIAKKKKTDPVPVKKPSIQLGKAPKSSKVSIQPASSSSSQPPAKKRQRTEDPSEPSPKRTMKKVSDKDEVPFPTISHMRERIEKNSEVKEALLEFENGHNEWIKVEDARKEHPNLLLNYLLSRVKFMEHHPGDEE